MSHCVTAIIAGTAVARHILKGTGLVTADLKDDFQLVPLDNDDLDPIGSPFNDVADGFTYLSPNLNRFLCKQSFHGPLVYLETDYFGGTGTQAAVAFINGSPIDSTIHTGDGAINTALRTIGVLATSGLDEFDHIGLSHHRHTYRWKEASHNSNV